MNNGKYFKTIQKVIASYFNNNKKIVSKSYLIWMSNVISLINLFHFLHENMLENILIIGKNIILYQKVFSRNGLIMISSYDFSCWYLFEGLFKIPTWFCYKYQCIQPELYQVYTICYWCKKCKWELFLIEIFNQRVPKIGGQ